MVVTTNAVYPILAYEETAIPAPTLGERLHMSGLFELYGLR